MWTSLVSKGLLRLCDKQSKTWLLVEMKFLFRVQLDISLVRCAHSWAIELNTWREIPYLRAPLYCCLSLSPRATLTLLSCVATSRVHHNSMVARCTLTISFVALRLSNIFHFVYKKKKKSHEPLRQHATCGQMERAYQPIRAHALVKLCYKSVFR